MSEKINGEEKASIGENTKDKNVGRSGPFMPGVFLIVLGLFFLAKNLTGFYLDNWWAIFILIPAADNFSRGITSLRREGKLSRSARKHFFWSLFFVLLSAAFLISLNFGILWPVFIILAGIGVLFGAL